MLVRFLRFRAGIHSVPLVGRTASSGLGCGLRRSAAASARGQDQLPWQRNPSLVTAATNYLWVVHQMTVNGDNVFVNSEIVIVFLSL